MISTNTKDFSWKPYLPDFEYRRNLVFSYFHSQIWLSYLLDEHHFEYITKSLKETLGRPLYLCAHLQQK
jgi:hypothetical protein